MTPSPTSLSAWLASLPEERLAEVLRRRPDVLRGRRPRTIGEVADQLQHTHSVYLAVEQLCVPELEICEVLVALGQGVTRAEVIDLLGTTEVDEALAGLAAIALVWPAGERLWYAPVIAHLFPRPLGTAGSASVILQDRTVTDLRKLQTALQVPQGGNKAAVIKALAARYGNAEFVRARAVALGHEARDLLARRAAPVDPSVEVVATPAPFDPAEYARRRAAEDAAIAAGLLLRSNWGGDTIMPAEVTLALRGPQWHPRFTPHAPEPALQSVTPEAVSQEASACLTQFTEHAAAALDAVAAEPLSCLKSGGVGTREITRLARRIGADERTTRLVLATACDAGLIAVGAARAVTTAGFAPWRDQEPAERAASLLVAWWDLADTPTVTRDRDGKATPALMATMCPQCRDGRQLLMSVVAELPSGTGTSPGSAADAAWWRRPNAHLIVGEDATTLLAWREAELLGVLAHGALSTVGAALVTGDEARLAAELTTLLPRSARSASFGSDLTVLVPGSPSAAIRSLLDSCADREGRGGAATWRISPGSVRRALDAGRTADGLAIELAQIATGELPQPLRYLIADVGRRHGHLRVVTAATCVVAADAALLAEVAGHRSVRALSPRLLAPTVLACAAPPADVLATLRRAGYLPVADDATSEVRIEQPVVRAPRVRARPVTARAAPIDTLAVARALRRPGSPAGDAEVSATADLIEQFASGLQPSEIRDLAHAVDNGGAILLDYVSSSGGHTTRVVSELELDPPHLSGWCHLREDERVFSLSRIRSVSAL